MLQHAIHDLLLIVMFAYFDICKYIFSEIFNKMQKPNAFV